MRSPERCTMPCRTVWSAQRQILPLRSSCSRATVTALPPATILPISVRSRLQGTPGASPAFRFIGNLGKATKPLIAAVQGNAVAVGTTMLLHCDLGFLAENTRLITPFVDLTLA